MKLTHSRLACLTAIALSVAPAALSAQSRPYSLDDILAYVGGGVAAPTVISKARNSCIAFKLTSSVVSKLRAEGATDALVTGLRSACYRSADGSEPHSEPKVKPRDRVVIMHDTVVVQPKTRTDTVVIYRPVTTEPVTTNPVATPIYDYDFRTYRGADVESTDTCKKSYELGVYTLTGTGGHFCNTTWYTSLDNVRIEMALTMVRGEPRYEAGIRFGVPTDYGSGYYFLIDGTGEFSLQRSIPGKWSYALNYQSSSLLDTRPNAVNKLSMEVRGRSISLFINGSLAGTYQADSPVTGYAGVSLYTSTGSATATVTRFSAVPLR